MMKSIFYLRKIATKNGTKFIGLLLMILGNLMINSCTRDRTTSVEIKSDVVWQIGNSDGLSLEFAAGHRDSVQYVIGKSTASKDFPSSQFGNLSGEAGNVINNPYTISFNRPLDSLDYY